MEVDLKSLTITIFIALALLLPKFKVTEALECYVCENCVEGVYLKECDDLPILPTQGTPTQAPTVVVPAASTQSQAVSTNAPASSSKRPTTVKDKDSEENYSDYDDSDEDRRRNSDVIRIVSGRILSLTKINNTLIDVDFHEDSLDTKFKTKANNVMQLNSSAKQQANACFMVKYRVNNTQITSLGCISYSQSLTCQSLNRSDAAIEDCEFCYKNGCNKEHLDGFDNDEIWDYTGFNTGNKNAFIIWNIIVKMVLVLLW